MKEITLKTLGVSIVIRPTRLEPDHGFVDFEHDMRMEIGTRGHVDPRQRCRIYKADLLKLAKYIRLHVGEDLPHGILPSPVFYPLELDFNTQALTGEIGSWEDGEFSIRWMISSGRSDREPSVYIGCETMVDVREALRWAADLERLAAELK